KHHCTFCGLNGLSMAYRAKTPDRAFREILELAERYGVDEVTAVDNILAMDYFRELLPRLKARGIGLKLFYEVKANLTREQVRLRVDRFSPFFTTPEALGLRNLRPDRAYRHVYDLGDEVLDDLAYYFEHDYAEGRAADEYIAPARLALDRWTRSRGNHGLVYTDDGTRLALCDFRPGADGLWTALTGAERER